MTVETWNAYRILVEKPVGERSLGKQRRWEGKIDVS